MSICARCEHFTVQHHPQQAAHGLGHCVGFLASIESFVDWNGTPCRLYRQAKQMAPRDRWILVQEARIAGATPAANVAAA